MRAGGSTQLTEPQDAARETPEGPGVITDEATAAPAPQPQESTASSARNSGAYALEWSVDDAVCIDALGGLNRGHVAGDAVDAAATDYASVQAATYLRSDQQIEWRIENAAGEGGVRETAEIDFYNDGTIRRVARLRTTLAGNRLVVLGVENPDSAEITPLSFAYAGAGLNNLPDTDNLNTKLTYSVSEIVATPQGHYSLVMPLTDVDASGRIYLSGWAAKDNASAPFTPGDYYAALICVFGPNDQKGKG